MLSQNDIQQEEISVFPNYSKMSWLGLLGQTLLFFIPPFTLFYLWRLIRFSMTEIFGEFMGRFFLPSQQYDENSIKRIYNGENENIGFLEKMENINSGKTLTAEQRFIKTEDGARLSTLEIKTRNEESINKDVYVIHFPENATVYEVAIDDLVAHANEWGCNVVAFNYRNVFKSKGKAPQSFDDLVSDGVHQVYRLLKANVPPKKIVLKGKSLGAAVAACVAAYYHENKMPVFHYNASCFSSFTNVITGWISAESNPHYKQDPDPKISGHSETFFGILLSWLARPFISLTLRLTGWEKNIESVFRELPESHREYIMVKAKKTGKNEYNVPIRELSNIGDATITDAASLPAAISDLRVEKKTEYEEMKQACLNLAVKDEDIAANQLESCQIIDEKRNAMKEYKFYYEDHPEKNAHLASEEELINCNKVSAFEHFGLFIKQKVNHKHKTIVTKTGEFEPTHIELVPEEKIKKIKNI